jgi:hypothetical protein
MGVCVSAFEVREIVENQCGIGSNGSQEANRSNYQQAADLAERALLEV